MTGGRSSDRRSRRHRAESFTGEVRAGSQRPIGIVRNLSRQAPFESGSFGGRKSGPLTAAQPDGVTSIIVASR